MHPYHSVKCDIYVIAIYKLERYDFPSAQMKRRGYKRGTGCNLKGVFCRTLYGDYTLRAKSCRAELCLYVGLSGKEFNP